MRKLAPMFVMTSIVALAGGAALANTSDTTTSTDKMGSPTVEKNTQNPQGLSYSDKSNMSPGTNAKIDSSTSVATDDTVTGAAKKKPKKAKIASNTTAKSTNDMSSNPPVSSKSPAAANSVTGQSTGGDGGSAGAGAGAGAGSSK